MTDIIAPPSVRALAREKGIDLEELARTLHRNNIVREDLEAEKPAAVAGASADTSYWDVDHSRPRSPRSPTMNAHTSARSKPDARS